MQSVDPIASRKSIILCAPFLGGAEIFTLERLLQANSRESILFCNSSLGRMISEDNRYDSIHVVCKQCLDDLAIRVSLRNICTGAKGLHSIIEDGGVLFGNLRSASLVLHTFWARKNDSFVHDNSHYLNWKARLLVFLIVTRSNITFFPCRHSILRVPFYSWLSSRIAINYFENFHSLNEIRRPIPKCLSICVVGRIEPEKNQKLAFGIANKFAGSDTRVKLTLLGAISDPLYYGQIVKMDRNHNLEISRHQVPRSEIPNFLKSQDVVVHTSVMESVPLVLFEANAAGIPFFALPIGGIPEVLPQKFWLDVDIDKSVRQIRDTLYD